MINIFFVIFCSFIFICYWFSFPCFSQISDKKPIEEILIGTWVEVPGQKEVKSLFQVNYFAPDTMVFFKNNTLKSQEHGMYIHSIWKIDKTNNNLIVDFEGDSIHPPQNHVFKFLTLTEDNIFIESVDEDADEDEIFRIKFRKLPEK